MRRAEPDRTAICLVGHLTRDIIVIAGRPVTAVGGTALYAGVTYARLGLPTRVVTRVAARDEEALSRPLRREGVDVQVFAASSTTTFENELSSDLRARTQRVSSVAEPFEDAALLAVSGEVVHLGPLTRDEMSMAFIEKARARCSWLVLDVQGLVRGIEDGRVVLSGWPSAAEVMPLCHIVKADADEALAVTGERDPRRAALAANRMGAAEVLVTLAEGGAYVAEKGEVSFVPAFSPERAVDSTGAGDTYTAGYVFARLRGEDVLAAARFAAAVASLSIEHTGPFGGTLADVDRRLRS